MQQMSVDRPTWICANTADSKSVIELGSMFFNQLRYVDSGVKIKVGIEIHRPYVDRAEYNDCIKICGDALNYRELLKNCELDTVMMIDFLEHLDRTTAFDLVENLKKDFNKILLFLPAGSYAQSSDIYNLGADYYQTHRSTWYDQDVLLLDFDEVILDPFFFVSFKDRADKKLDIGAYFCIWKKNMERTSYV